MHVFKSLSCLDNKVRRPVRADAAGVPEGRPVRLEPGPGEVGLLQPRLGDPHPVLEEEVRHELAPGLGEYVGPGSRHVHLLIAAGVQLQSPAPAREEVAVGGHQPLKRVPHLNKLAIRG